MQLLCNRERDREHRSEWNRRGKNQNKICIGCSYLIWVISQRIRHKHLQRTYIPNMKWNEMKYTHTSTHHNIIVVMRECIAFRLYVCNRCWHKIHWMSFFHNLLHCFWLLGNRTLRIRKLCMRYDDNIECISSVDCVCVCMNMHFSMTWNIDKSPKHDNYHRLFSTTTKNGYRLTIENWHYKWTYQLLEQDNFPKIKREGISFISTEFFIQCKFLKFNFFSNHEKRGKSMIHLFKILF